MSIPQSTLRIVCTIEGKIKEPPDPPNAKKNDPSSSVIIVGAMDDSGRFPGAG
jgi:hypothetical protein